jgi:hypothetical protein
MWAPFKYSFKVFKLPDYFIQESTKTLLASYHSFAPASSPLSLMIVIKSANCPSSRLKF